MTFLAWYALMAFGAFVTMSFLWLRDVQKGDRFVSIATVAGWAILWPVYVLISAVIVVLFLCGKVRW